MIIALICFAVTNSTLSDGNTASQHPYDSGLLVLLAFVDCAPLALRTRFPIAAWAASWAALIGTAWRFRRARSAGRTFRCRARSSTACACTR